MATLPKDKLELVATQAAADLIANKQLTTPVTANKSTASTGATSGITPSYYNTPSNATNYESNMPVYKQSDAVKEAAAKLAEKEASKPASYNSQYTSQIQDLINKALNRGPFSYDFSSDPLYNQYADKYTQQAKQASKSAIGDAASLTGGYANSYAQTAGQQAYQQYMTSLNDMIPELRNSAYAQYQDAGNTIQQNLSMLQTQDSADYSKYRDTVTDYQTELNYLYNKSNDMSEQEYNRYQNDRSAWQNDRAYWYQKAQDDAVRAAAASKRGGSGGGRKSTTYSAPTTYSEYAALTGDAGSMTATEWQRHKNSGSSAVAGTNSYADYLKAMIAKKN